MRIGRGRAAVFGYNLLNATLNRVQGKAGGRFDAVSQKTCMLHIQQPFAEKGVV